LACRSVNAVPIGAAPMKPWMCPYGPWVANIVSRKRQRYLANLHRRCNATIGELRIHLDRVLTDDLIDLIDRLGTQISAYVVDYRGRHGVRPTRRDVCAALQLVERLAPVPVGLPGLLHRTWRANVTTPVFAAAPPTRPDHLYPRTPIPRGGSAEHQPGRADPVDAIPPTLDQAARGTIGCRTLRLVLARPLTKARRALPLVSRPKRGHEPTRYYPR
jgi:hypothetical protein